MNINLYKKILLVDQSKIDESILKKLSYSKLALKARISDIHNHDVIANHKMKLALCFDEEDVTYAKQHHIPYYYISEDNQLDDVNFVSSQEAIATINKIYNASISYYYIIPNVTYLILIFFIFIQVYTVIPYWLVLFIAQFILCKYQLRKAIRSNSN